MAKPDVIGIEWGNDIGVVCLSAKALWVTANGSFDQVNWHIPHLAITDDDFKHIGIDPEESSWDDVVPLLLHPEFKLSERLREDASSRTQ